MKKRLSFFFFCIAILGIFPAPALAGLGVSPGTIQNDHLLPGTTYQGILYLSRDEATKELFVSPTLLLPEADSWFTFEEGDQVHFLENQHMLAIPYAIHTPITAEKKQYLGKLYFQEKNTDLANAGGSSQAVVGTALALDFTVTATKIQDFLVQNTVIGTVYRPYPFGPFTWPGNLAANITLKNIGNTAVTPSKISLSIYDTDDKTLLEQTIAQSPTIEAYATQKAEIIFPFHLGPGTYHGRIQVYNGYKPVTDQPISLTFTVPEEKNNTVIFYKLQQWATYLAVVGIFCALLQIGVFLHFQHAQYRQRKRQTVHHKK